VNCAGARAALAVGSERETGDLARHLRDCPRCAELVSIDRRIDDARSRLIEQAPPRVDVHDRVMSRIEHLAPGGRDDPRAWQLALAQTAAALAVVTLVALAWQARPGWSAVADDLDQLARILGHLASALGSVALAGLRAAGRVLALTRELAFPLVEYAGRLEPAPRVGVGLSYMTMFLAILRVLDRDLRGRARPRTEERP